MIEAPTTEPLSSTLTSPIQVQPPYVSINGTLYVDLKDWDKTDLDQTFISAADVTRYVNQNTRGIRKSCVLSSSPTKHLIAVNSLIDWVSKNREYLGRRHTKRKLQGVALQAKERAEMSRAQATATDSQKPERGKQQKPAKTAAPQRKTGGMKGAIQGAGG